MKQAQNIGKTLTKLTNAAPADTTFHAKVGFAGYEQYKIRASKDNSPYLLWNQANDSQLAKGKASSWHGIFDAEPYLTYPPDTKGNTFPQMPSALLRLLDKDFILKRRERYAAFIGTLNIKDKPAMQVLSEQEGLFRLIQESLQRQINSMERIDDDIKQVLKVFYFECEQKLKPVQKENKEAFYQLLDDVEHLYQTGIRVYCTPDVLAEKWLPEITNKPHVPEPIAQSTTAGILDLCRQKENVLLQAVPFYEKLVHLETLKSYALNDMPLLPDDEQALPGEFRPRNETGQKMKAASKQIDELYLPDIIRIANELIQQKGRAECVTVNGTAKRSLCFAVHRKLKTKPGRVKPAQNTIKKKIEQHVLSKK